MKIYKIKKIAGADIIDLCKLIVRGKVIFTHGVYMSDIINFLYHDKQNMLLKYLSDISGEQIYDNTLIRVSINERLYNPITRFIFVVSDLGDLTHTLKKKYEEFKSVNTGPQKFRGSTSSLNYTLIKLDNDFRDSMYKHNRIYFENPLPRSKFSFNNIHVNLGSVRW